MAQPGSRPAPATETPATASGQPTRAPGPPNPYGAYAVADGLGGVAAPLLAGFAITLVALVVQIAGTLRWPDAALILLGLAAVLFLHVVQLNARARGYAVTPSQVREWYPDFDDPARRRVVDWELAHHRACWAHLVRRTRRSYNLGVLVLLAAIAVILVPSGAVSAGRVVAVAIVAIGIGWEVLEIVDARLRRRPARRIPRWLRRAIHRLAATDPPVPAPPFPGPAAPRQAGAQPPQ